MNNQKRQNDFRILAHKGDESHLLKELYRTSQVLINNLSQIVGISASRLGLIRLLAVELQEEVGIMEIARRLGINAAAVSRLVNEMETKKWVSRRTSPEDGRRTYIKLTARGRNQFQNFHERMHEFERLISEKIEKKDIETAIRVLSQIRNTFEQIK